MEFGQRLSKNNNWATRLSSQPTYLDSLRLRRKVEALGKNYKPPDYC